MTSRHNAASLLVLSIMAITTIGCGGSEGNLKTAKAGGKVTFNGQPVTGGTITLLPQGTGVSSVGKPASGPIKSDGSFTLTTYTADDGAVVGKHRASYMAPAGTVEAVPEGGHAAAAAKSPFDGLSPKTPEVEIKAGPNELAIELAPAN